MTSSSSSRWLRAVASSAHTTSASLRAPPDPKDLCLDSVPVAPPIDTAPGVLATYPMKMKLCDDPPDSSGPAHPGLTVTSGPLLGLQIALAALAFGPRSRLPLPARVIAGILAGLLESQ